MRRYVVTFWKKHEEVWPEISGKLIRIGGGFNLIEKPDEYSVVVECTEGSARFIRDREEVKSLLIRKSQQAASS